MKKITKDAMYIIKREVKEGLYLRRQMILKLAASRWAEPWQIEKEEEKLCEGLAVYKATLVDDEVGVNFDRDVEALDKWFKLYQDLTNEY